jgi:YD repeat-containing protein
LKPEQRVGDGPDAEGAGEHFVYLRRAEPSDQRQHASNRTTDADSDFQLQHPRNHGFAFLQSATNPEDRTVSYTYNNGLIASKTDAKSQQIKYTYDTYNRLTQVSHFRQRETKTPASE